MLYKIWPPTPSGNKRGSLDPGFRRGELCPHSNTCTDTVQNALPQEVSIARYFSGKVDTFILSLITLPFPTPYLGSRQGSKWGLGTTISAGNNKTVKHGNPGPTHCIVNCTEKAVQMTQIHKVSKPRHELQSIHSVMNTFINFICAYNNKTLDI